MNCGHTTTRRTTATIRTPTMIPAIDITQDAFPRMRALLMACGPWTYSCQHASTTTKTLQSEHSRIFAYSNSPVSSASFLFKQLHWLYRLLLAENVGSYIMSHPYTLDIKSTNTVNSSERLKTSRS